MTSATPIDEASPDSASVEVARPEGSPPRSRRVPLIAATPVLPLIALPLALAFAFLAGRPLWHTDLWGHLAYGRLIWQERALPPTEPFMPLASGVELIDTAWLSQVIGFLTIERFGLPGLQLVAAACVAVTLGVLAWLGYRRTGSIAWTLCGLAAYAWLNWKQLFNGADLSLIIRPQMAGILAFTVTLAVVASRPARWHWFVVPVTFAVWANVHGSFLAGLALVAVFSIGRAGDVLRRTDKFGAIARDWPFWRLVLLGELAAVAALVNPYGLRIYADTWLFVRHPNLQDIVEWEPLTLRMMQGQAVAGVAFVLLFLYRMTPRRITTGETLALLLFGGLTLWTSRMIVWWAPVAAYALMLHGAACWSASRARTRRTDGLRSASAAIWSERSPLWIAAALGVALVGFAFTLSARGLVRGGQDRLDGAISSQTPIGAAEHLAAQPPIGQIFNTYELGDYLLWSNPKLPVFVAGHAHLVPRDVWQAYVDAIRGGAGWEATLDRYGVNTLVLDKPARQPLIDRLMEEPDWRRSYEDRNSAVFRRTVPLRSPLSPENRRDSPPPPLSSVAEPPDDFRSGPPAPRL